MRRRRTTAGFTMLEALIATVIGIGIITGGFAVTSSTADVAASSASSDAASRHVERVMRAVADAVRGGSLAAMCRDDGVTPFADHSTDTGLTVRHVRGYSGGVILDSPITYRLVMAPGAAKGEVVSVQDGVEQVVARGITALSFTRDDDAFTVTVAAHTGPEDHRGRNARGSVTVRTRNP